MSAATVSINKKLTDGTLLSIGGTDAEDFLVNVKALLGGDDAVISTFEKAFAATAATASFEQAAANVTSAFPDAQPEQQWRQSAPPAAAPKQGPPPGTSAPACDHGQPREWKTGTNKTTQKPWKGWFCQNPNRDAQCAPSWVR